jgi:3',5'-cyclic AMP phosphodiesterase CpdA
MLAQITDPHVGIEPAAEGRLAAAIAEVRALAQVPDAVLVSGDLAADGRPEEYTRVRELFGELPAAVHVLAGNHDKRAELRAAFGIPGAGDDPIRYAVRCGPLRLVACDTIVPGHHHGELDLAWLGAQLAADADTPTIVAMHHPPMLLGIPVMDELALRAPDRAGLAELLRGAPQVRRVVCGHVHRTSVGSVGGCPVLTLASTEIQHRLDFAAREFDLVAEPADVAVHVLVDGEVVSHVQPVTGRPG